MLTSRGAPSGLTQHRDGEFHPPQVPRSLRDAIAELENSAFARTAFGDQVVDHLLHFARAEQKAFDVSVTDWERARFFERI